MTAKDQRIIMAVPTARINRLLAGDGVRPLAAATVGSILTSPLWVARGPAETDESILQVIPYVVVTVDPGRRHVLAYRRPGGGEGRLEGCASIGLGGHIEQADWGGATSHAVAALITTRQAALRELAEELPGLEPDPGRLATLGLIVGHRLPDAGPVEKVHLGVLMHYDAHGQPFRGGDELADLAAVDRDALADLGRPEHWTRCVLRALADGTLPGF